MKKQILAAVFALAMTAPAFAGSCPLMINQIDEALAAAPDLDESTKTQVMLLRDQGEALHNEGNHDESIAVLHQAKALLGIE
ncbi:MAG: hypothetical protein AAF530_22085 [Pseudomonadota bacterium]